MTSRISLGVKGTLAASPTRDIALRAVSEGSTRTVQLMLDSNAANDPITLQSVWRELTSLAGLSELPDLPSDLPFIGVLFSTGLSVTATIGTDPKGGVSASLELAYGTRASARPVAIPKAGDLLPTFIVVESLLIAYAKATGFTVRAKVSVPATKQGAPPAKIVAFPPPVPASASKGPFKVNYLGVGQRVGPDTVGLGQPDPMAAIFAQLETELANPDPAAMLGAMAAHFYKPDRDWFFALDVQLRDFNIKALFNDPAMYGLRIAVDNATSPYAGLLFEILYQKLGPTLGVYFGALTLPDRMRQIELDGVLLVLPGLSIWVFTNGDFRINVGWPLGSGSISASVGNVLAGKAGFYFAKLRSSDVPGAGAAYNPILQFGIALDLGAAVDFSAGPLSASLTVALTGMLQGVLGWLDGNDVGNSPDAYWFAGTVGLVVIVQGSVDFGIIQASVSLQLTAAVAAAFENGRPSVIAVSAEVSVDVSVKVLFVHIHFSFDMMVTHSFQIGGGDLPAARLEGPWNAGLAFTPTAGAGAALAATGNAALSPPPTATPPKSTPKPPAPDTTVARLKPTQRPDTARAALLRPFLDAGLAGTKLAVTAQFVLLPTVLFDVTPRPALVAALALDCPAPGTAPSTTALTAFEALAAALLGWLLGTVQPRPADAASWLQAATASLGHGGDPPDPAVFATRAAFGTNAMTALTVTVVPGKQVTDVLPAALLPMPDGMTLTPGTLAAAGLGAMRVAKTATDDLTGDSYAPANVTADAGAAGETLAHLLLSDWLLVLLRQLVASLDLPDPSADPLADLATSLSGCNLAHLAGFASRMLLSGVQVQDGAGVIQPLYVATKQQFEGATSASLAITAPGFVAKTVTATADLGKGVPVAPSYQWGTSFRTREMEVVQTIPRSVALASPTQVKTKAADTAVLYGLARLPPSLLPGPRATDGYRLTLATDDGTGGRIPVAAGQVLLVALSIARIKSTLPGQLWLPCIYAVQGTDDETRDKLEALWQAAPACTLTVLAPNTGAMTVVTGDATLVRTMPAPPGGADTQASAGSADATGFLRLLWEACTDQGKGMILHVPGLAGQEGAVFGSNITGMIDIMAAPGTPAGDGLAGWVNRLHLPWRPATLFADVFQCALAGTALVAVTDARPAAQPGTIGFVVEIGAPPPTAAFDAASMYHMVQFKLDDGAWGRPISPSDSPDAGATWSFRHSMAANAHGSTARYGAIGTVTSVRFRLMDVFGNILPESCISGAAPLMLTARHADALVAPSEWPGVQFLFGFTPGPVLTLDCVFAADGLSTETLARYVARFALIGDQLASPGMTATLATSLDPKMAATAPVLATLIRFVAKVQAALAAAAPSDKHQVAAVQSAAITQPLTPGALAARTTDVLPLTATVTLTRTQDLPDTAAMPEIGSVSSLVHPNMVPAAGDTLGVKAFATAFEAAFGHTLRLAQRAALPSGDAPNEAPALWAVACDARGLAITAAAAGVTSFALRPLANQLITMQQGEQVYAGVDLDAVALRCLGAIDAALAPGRAVQLAAIGLLQPLLAAKQTLATAIANGLTNVLDESGDQTTASATLCRALLRSLGTAGTVSTVVQARVTVASLDGVPTMLGDFGPPPPSGGALPHQSFSFSSAQLQQATSGGAAVLTSLLSVADPAGQPSLTLPLRWAPALLEHDVELGPSYAGFTPSSQLAFVLPWPAVDLGTPVLPLPLWTEPVPPKLLWHKAAEAEPDPAAASVPNPAMADKIGSVLHWRYSVQLSATLTGQDELRIDPGLNAAAPAPEPPPPLPPGVAGLFQAATGFAGRLAGYGPLLAALDTDTPPGKDALTPFVTDAAALATAWSALAQAPAPQPAAPAPLALAIAAGKVTLRAQAAPGPNGWPSVTFGTGAPLVPDGPARGEDGIWELSHPQPDGLDLTAPLVITLAWNQIAFRDDISADFRCHVERNPSLVHARPSDAAFVLRTPVSGFPTPLVPLLAWDDTIDIVPGPSQSLQSLVGDLLGTLADLQRLDGKTFSLTCTFCTHLVADGGGLPMRFPVLMGDDLALPSAAGVPAMAAAIAGEVADWRRAANPVERAASVEFALMLFGAPSTVVGAQRLPLVRLRRIAIAVPADKSTEAAFWPPPPAGKTA